MGADGNVVKEFIDAIKEPPQDNTRSYSAIVSRIDNEGTVWVHLAGSEKETPTALVASEVERGDVVNVEWRNNRLYVASNASNPAAGYFSTQGAVDFVSALEGQDISVNSIKASVGYIDDLYSKNITTENINAATGYIKDLTSENITAQNIVADHADVNTLKANKADIDLANVNVAWIEQGNIKKAEVFDENVFDLSGNRATLSRIDASKINVANLRADNLVVRRINGQPVVGGYTLISNTSPGYESKNPQELGWYEFVNAQWVLSTDTTVDMTKAYYQEGDEVSLYDQTYIDGLKNDLQQQIDGAVETFTGSVVPTLVNYPYTDWYDTSVTPIHDERAKHVGDIYYVVNSSADEGGYCYRFAFDETNHEYMWVLIKDTDITKALSDISELQTFESETTSWIDETDQGLETIRTNHTALSGRVDTVETTANNALPAATFESFESTTFTDLVDEVDEQSTTMTNMTTRLGLNADGSQSATDIVAKESALEQTVDGISSRVGKTEMHLAGMYATSSTAAGTAAKVATIVPALSNYELANGAMVTVKFTAANTTASPTLNLNGTGAKAIKTYSGGNLTEDEYKWKAGSTFTFTYNGTNWLMQDSTASVRMSSAETQIEQTANNVLIKATETDITAAQGGQHLIQSLINVAPEGVTIDADKVNITGTTIFNKVNADASAKAAMLNSEIEIGGRNLLTGTAESKTLTTQANQSWFTPQPYKLSDFADIAIADTSNTQITLSFDYSITGVDTAFNMVASTRTTSSGSYNAAVEVAEIPVGSSSGHALGTRTITNDMRQYSIGHGILISGSGNANANAVLTIKNVKLEFGNKATDWTPAPEDIQAEIDAKKSVFTLTTAYSGFSYAQLLDWSEEGHDDYWTVNEGTAGIKVDDTVRIQIKVNDMGTASNRPSVYIVGTVKAIDSATRLQVTSHGLDTTIIDGGNILTNSIGANQIKANSIGAKHILVSDRNNYITATENNADTLEGGVISDGWIYKNNTNANLALSHQLDRWVTKGEKYRITGTVKAPATGCAVIVIYGRDSGGVAISSSSLTVPIETANASTTVNGIIEITEETANQVKNNVAIVFCTTSVWSSNYQMGYCKQMKCERMSGGSLIVDGSITADHLASNSITVGKMNQDAKDQVLNSNISIGGRNLLINTGTASGYHANVTPSGTTLAYDATNGGFYRNMTATTESIVCSSAVSSEALVGTEYYTLTLWIKSSVARSFALQLRKTTGVNDGGNYTSNSAIAVPANTWTKLTHTFKGAATSSMVYARLYVAAGTASNIYIKEWKLEKGNKETDWTPAPEDETHNNLLIDSQKMGQWVCGASATKSTSDTFGVVTLNGTTANWGASLNSAPTIKISALDGTPLYLSFEYKVSVSTSLVYAIAATSNSEGGQPAPRTIYKTVGVTLPVASSWTRHVISVPITTVADLTQDSGSANSMFVQFYNRTDSSALQLRKVKLEHGAYASQWTPSAEEYKTYITRIDDNGIRIHPASTENNSVLINGNGMYIYQGGTDTAHERAYFTANAAAIGTNGGNRSIMNDTGFHVYQLISGVQTEVASFGSTARIGAVANGKPRIEIGASSINLIARDSSGTDKSITLGLRTRSSSQFMRLGSSKTYLMFADTGNAATSDIWMGMEATGSTDPYLLNLSYDDFRIWGDGSEIPLTVARASKTIQTSYSILLNNNMAIKAFDSYGSTSKDIMRLDDGNSLVLGYGNYQTGTSGYNSWLEGYNVYLRATNKCYANGSQITTSDKRLKKDIIPISDKFKSLFMDLQPVEYKMEQSQDKDIHFGLTAQDVEMAFIKNNISIEKYALVDEYEYPEEKTRYKALAYTEFIPMCIQMIQSQQKELETLKGEINALRRN